MKSDSSNTSSQSLWLAGLWGENPALVKLLGLCPLLAVSNNAANGLGLGIATLITLLVSNTIIAAMRRIIDNAIRIPVYVIVIASTVSLIDLSMQAWYPQLHASLGIFLPLIVTNCLIIGRAEAFASRRSIPESFQDAMAMGLGFLWVLVLLGGLRELIGQGSLLDQAHLLFGEIASDWTIHVFEQDKGMLIALLPPGAFLVLGLLLATKNLVQEWFDLRKQSQHTETQATEAALTQ